ncbi:hypothetical protein JYU29_01890 [Tianweitania sp. BSSL-BM11]|uniref:Response regulatory domain-containing protein n=1 Tax=Tianweitania aestuarii TaxID=2814886 RepID=A0ABS5RQW2_9HYPH|nr:hypothetical protein [Tianweitania aestuarii]MBS9719433.1 hypothetical protein [Tianweitania aestuarii]
MSEDKLVAPTFPVTARFPDDAKAEIQPSVVAVGDVPVNLVVVTRIAQRARLHAVALSPNDAIRSLPVLKPMIVILDGGVDDRQYDALLDVIRDNRQKNGQGHPRLLYLSAGQAKEAQSRRHPVFDAVVSKPILPERLEAALSQLAGQSR